MHMVDIMLDGDEPIVAQITEEAGPLVANQFVAEFNNACMQMAGFEEEYEVLSDAPVLLAPLNNLSWVEH